MRALGGAIACPSLLGVPLGHNSSFLQRPAFAPPRIREAIWCGSTNSSTEGGKELEDPQVLTDVGDVPIREIRDCGVNDDRLMNVINESVKLVMEEAPLRPLVLDGNHSISYPVVRAVSEKLGGPVDILYLDAHLDIYHCFEGNKYSVYISIDVDCLDPAFAPGMSYIKLRGLSFCDVLNILHNLQGDIVTTDVVEFNLQRDTVDSMNVIVAAKLVRELTAKIAK
ncbi:Arginase 1 [Arachis hypogaea]|nr:Arginase 1 [Arachis hypogaea]